MKGLTSEVLTQRIRETFKSLRNISVVLEQFEVTQQKLNEILNGTGPTPLLKALGTDLVADESRREAWRSLVMLPNACGRLAYTPSFWGKSRDNMIFRKGKKEGPYIHRPSNSYHINEK